LLNIGLETLDIVEVILVQLQEKRVDQTQSAPLFTVSVAQSLERRSEDLDACRPIFGVRRLVDVDLDLGVRRLVDVDLDLGRLCRDDCVRAGCVESFFLKAMKAIF
jgi:hypothetical protein